MRLPRLILGLASIALLLSATPAKAQFWAGSPYYGGMAWGGYPAGQLNTMRQLTAESRQTGQLAAMGQNYVVQSGIRNTLTTQAQERTNAILGKQQSNQDWWFQTQQQQMNQRQARGYAAPPPVAGFDAGPAGGTDLVEVPPQVEMDIIKWPTVLQGPAFAARRAMIEAPYRRSPPGLSAPTAADYRQMVQTIADMKAILECLLGEGGLVTEDYQQAKAFLDKIGNQARERSAADAPLDQGPQWADARPSSPLRKGATAGLSSSAWAYAGENTAGQASSGTQNPEPRLFQRAAWRAAATT